jgi:small redox-active disulfide protein 2
MVIKILGSGCKNCVTLAENVNQVICEMNIRAHIEKVTDYGEIASYGVMSTPALVIDEEVVSYGKVSTVSELNDIFSNLSQ